MKPPADPRAQCHAKMPWPTKAAALDHRRRLLDRRRNPRACHKEKARGVSALHPYRCPSCHQWHLGNPSEGKVAK